MLDAPLLELRDLGRRFGAVRALAGVDLTAAGGQVHALTGANGAGKSTLMNLLAGVYPPSSGEIRIDGRAMQFNSPLQAREAGINTVYQELTVLPELSVAENIWLGREPRTRSGLLDRRAMLARSATLLEEFHLPLDPKRRCADLNLATRQLVEIARALSSSARILSLDEPTAVLSPSERRRLFHIVAELKRRGLLILFVSHRLDEVFEIADEVTVLRNGERVFSGPMASLDRDALVRHMVGHTVDERGRVPVLADTQRPQLQIRVHGAQGATELTMKSGEIVGLAGLVGAGRTCLARRLAGHEAGMRADYRVGQQQFSVDSAAAGIRHGVIYLTEDRKRDGLFANLSVLKNTSAAALSSLSRLGVVDRAAERSAVVPILQRLRLVAASLQVPASELSGGNQQKLLFGRALLAKPILLICDEPTRGVDVGAREEIYALIDTLSREGVTMILVCSDLKELLMLCHRLLVVRGAAVVAELPAGASERDIVGAATEVA